MSKMLAFSFVIVAFVIGLAAGYIQTPEYQNMRQDRATAMMELGAADRYVDLRYLRGMIAHHQSAIYMLEQAQQKSHRQEIRDLAGAVITADLKGIDVLNSYKKNWYGDSKEVTQFQKINLGENDGKFDLRLLNALIQHHTEAIEKAEEIRTKSTRTEVLNVADEVITGLSANREQLKQWRKEWYNVE
jgi:uncharacterized protein (DUF305 family)